MIQSLEWKKLSAEQRKTSLNRPSQSSDPAFKARVAEIIRVVREERDSGLLRLTRQFDQVDLSSLRVTAEEIRAAYRQVSTETVEALKIAIQNVTRFHQAEVPHNIDLETTSGVRCERRFLPIQRVGLYIPGGSAPLPSTVVMLGVPSQLAGCPIRVLLTPPRKDQTVDPTILVAADLLGIDEIFKVGGAQAIAALAYGTETIPKVDKIFGPGNSWVTEAKLQVSQDAQGALCDMPAGPSEVMVIADSTAEPAFVAADLLSQAEHGSDSQVILVTDSPRLVERVQVEIEYQLAQLPRKDIATGALSQSLIIEVAQLEDALSVCNAYAPEHLIVQVNNAREFAYGVKNAGSVFIGPWTPESMGDYASGTNHVLPTYGFARGLSGLGTESFMKSITFQEVSYEGLKNLGPVVEILAAVEKLDAHKNAVKIRLQKSSL